jgi:hypothetical protein
MRAQSTFIVVLAILLLSCSSGCTYWRIASQPELWGLTIPETWEYGRRPGELILEARRNARRRAHEKWTKPRKPPEPTAAAKVDQAVEGPPVLPAVVPQSESKAAETGR